MLNNYLKAEQMHLFHALITQNWGTFFAQIFQNIPLQAENVHEKLQPETKCIEKALAT